MKIVSLFVSFVFSLLLVSCGNSGKVGDSTGGTSDESFAEEDRKVVYSLSRGDGGADSVVYCDAVKSLSLSLDEGGVTEYDLALDEVLAVSPERDQRTWQILKTVSSEPFTYDNFNLAADAADVTVPIVEGECEGLAFLILNDQGRIAILTES